LNASEGRKSALVFGFRVLSPKARIALRIAHPMLFAPMQLNQFKRGHIAMGTWNSKSLENYFVVDSQMTRVGSWGSLGPHRSPSTICSYIGSILSPEFLMLIMMLGAFYVRFYYAPKTFCVNFT